MQALAKSRNPSMAWLLARLPVRVTTHPSQSRRLAHVIEKRNLLPFTTVIYHGQAPSSPDYKFEAQQVFGSEVKTNPSQSEANVAADRGEIDPLPMGMHHTILLEVGEASVYMQPTDSEDAVHADRYMDDPMRSSARGGYC
jgi:hypothetical protein